MIYAEDVSGKRYRKRLVAPDVASLIGREYLSQLLDPIVLHLKPDKLKPLVLLLILLP
jgi:hypothetical protein